MSNTLNISNKEIIYYIKLSGQVPTLLEAIATRKIISDTAAKEGIKIETEELQQAADNLRLANKLLKAEDTWVWLEKHHLSLDDFEEIALANLLSTKLANHLFTDKIEHFFYANQLDYTGAVTYEVIFDDEDLALEIFYALQEGEISFQEIARQYIQNPEIRRAGGYQGIRPRSDFRPEIAAVVFAATPPQILKPIITPKGAHIIVVEEIIKPQLDEQLRLKIMGDLFTNWLKQQITTVEIVAKLAEDTNSQSSKNMLTQDELHV
ncbi:parvulin-like peptidyl-prolyl isomerase [Cylindrospermum stagnale PCC 7417]|uniref:peptidylprolyl isomerase n=1 Tax=Cylindrospermum stagnale PCC 7417 TaxID=56107 RepID=K9X5J9_9NOST|nr:peptidylprolyl isomerase [Cylindrospermum stagnale]AFZ27369.1 parvulin-like peptidyl-prolyl isomerase [Cylindrospermum stagnale PCC 7417]